MHKNNSRKTLFKPRLNSKPQRGFTLIEIIVVVAIIGLMLAAVAPSVLGRLEQAEQTRVAQDISAIESALKMYRLDNFDYPAEAEGLQALITAPSTARNWRATPPPKPLSNECNKKYAPWCKAIGGSCS